MENLNIESWKARRKEIITFLLKNGYLSKDFENDETVTIDKRFQLKSLQGRKLKVACILDEFSFASYAPECTLLQLTPDNWKSEIEAFQPDLFFFESAWQGKCGLWYHKIDRYSDELFELTTYLHNNNIPIVFWNKEDPVYTDIFMLAAGYADYVFTTDIDCIAKYKTELKHDRVYHLHFAAQPQIHNPIEKFERKNKLCFAGAYYHKYQERCQIFDNFCNYFIKNKGIDIYDRNFGNARPEHAFPDFYKPYILGNLSANEIDIAYKGYNYGINMNSIQQSQTMFARRVFELLASNTITIGNYSRGLKNYFGDLTIATDDEKTLKMFLKQYCADAISLRKYRLLGLRKVLTEHLYEDRLDYIIQKVFNKTIKKSLPKVTIFAEINNSKNAERVQRMFKEQTWQNAELILISDTKINNCRCITSEDAKKLYASDLTNADFITYFDENDWYGRNYLKDLVLTCRYGKFSGIGKSAYFSLENSKIIVKNLKNAYHKTNVLKLKQAIVVPELLKNLTVSQLGSYVIDNNNLFAVDEFNYCENFTEDYCTIAADIQIYDTGIDFEKIKNIAENVKYSEAADYLSVKGDDLTGFINASKKELFSFYLDNNILCIDSKLQDEKHEYVYLMKKKIEVMPWLVDGKLTVKFSGSAKLDLICVLLCYDKSGNKLKPLYPKLNRNEVLTLPENTSFVVLGFRLKGSGTAKIKEILFGNTVLTDGIKDYLLRSDVLVLTNQYPQPDNLYRNMFVHKRVMVYKDSGYVFDVMRMNIYAGNGFREFEGINVIEGQGTTLLNILESNMVKTVCVHFLDAEMWSILKPFVEKNLIKLFIWSHGADIQPWWRRTYNYKDDRELENAKVASEQRMKLWYDVFSVAEDNINIHFVFVSNYFANEVMEDYKVKLKAESYSIIHNLIDTNLFKYEKKTSEMRKKILTIKSFYSLTYANDLTAKGIVELSKRACFKNLDFEIYGRGERFDEDNAPLKKFKNVHLHNTFLTQNEIAEAHKRAGLFIATTRMDTQGVSRGEAMSSGLVPIANNCSAIPEFVDENCGILIPPESNVELADAIENLYNNPDLFMKLSEGAAKRVRSQCSKEHTIDKELKLICGE